MQDGAVKFTVAEVVDVTVALRLVGTDGLVAGTTDAEALEEGPVPVTLVAVTVRV